MGRRRRRSSPPTTSRNSITSSMSAAATARCCRPCSPPIRSCARRCLILREPAAPANPGEGGPLPGASFVTGDVFTTAAPEGGDVYLLRHLLHDYDDRDCVRILANVRRAMHPQARVLVLEAPLPSDDSPGPGRWLDLQVMLLSAGRPRPAHH